MRRAGRGKGKLIQTVSSCLWRWHFHVLSTISYVIIYSVLWRKDCSADVCEKGKNRPTVDVITDSGYPVLSWMTFLFLSFASLQGICSLSYFQFKCLSFS